MNLDQMAGGLCAVSAASVFFLHVASDPARKSWITLPRSVRWGFAAVGMTFAVRAADFLSIANHSEIVGHINIWGAMSALAMAYLAVASVACLWRHHMAGQQWDRLQEVELALRRNPELAPAALPKTQAGEVLRALGANVNAMPGGMDDERTRDG
ncbi:hypothetical protein [Phenylobacterium sp.]|jgi:hypothetical protein|uniref:hypothetical protein n=1 Tax=Phenylobacterium sp. TaxID=1871053 RepID=UPI002F408E66